MLAKLPDAGFTTDFYDSGPWQNGEQRWLFWIGVFGNRQTTDSGMLTAQVPIYTKQNRTSQHASICWSIPWPSPGRRVQRALDNHRSCGQLPAVLWRRP